MGGITELAILLTATGALALAWVSLGALRTALVRYPPRSPLRRYDAEYLACGRRAWALALLLAVFTLWSGYRALEISRHPHLVSGSVLAIAALRLIATSYVAWAFWPRREPR